MTRPRTPPADAWRRYADAKAAFLRNNPGATPDEIEAHARAVAEKLGL